MGEDSIYCIPPGVPSRRTTIHTKFSATAIILDFLETDAETSQMPPAMSSTLTARRGSVWEISSILSVQVSPSAASLQFESTQSSAYMEGFVSSFLESGTRLNTFLSYSFGCLNEVVEIFEHIPS